MTTLILLWIAASCIVWACLLAYGLLRVAGYLIQAFDDRFNISHWLTRGFNVLGIAFVVLVVLRGLI